MADPAYPTRPDRDLLDPLIHEPPVGVNLLIANEGGTLIKSPWYEGAIAWDYLPRIPQSVKDRMSMKRS